MPGGEVVLKFVITHSGAVPVAEITKSTLGDSKVEKCVLAALKRWSFPAPSDGLVVATHRFTLSSVGEPGASAEPASAELQRLRAEQRAQQRAQERAQERARERAAARAVERTQRRAREHAWARRKQPVASDSLEGPTLSVVELIEAGEGAAALLQARDWQRRSPSDVMALLSLARAAKALGQRDLAARAYGSLIDLFPSRADMRRAAGEGLEGLVEGGDGLAHEHARASALSLAIDSYRKAVELRPDHPSSHRLLAMALWRSGEQALAHAAFTASLTSSYRRERFPGVPGLLSDESAWTRVTGAAQHARKGEALLRACVYWETDATDVDLHVYDGAHRYVSGLRLASDSGAQLSGDVATGYGPECYTARGQEISYPYLFQAQYSSRGAMGYAMGALHITRIDRAGEPSFESRPFVLMREGGFATLGELTAIEHAPTLVMR
jgi:TonB family protein